MEITPKSSVGFLCSSRVALPYKLHCSYSANEHIYIVCLPVPNIKLNRLFVPQSQIDLPTAIFYCICEGHGSFLRVNGVYG